jgi:hypothetical protein
MAMGSLLATTWKRLDPWPSLRKHGKQARRESSEKENNPF